MLSDLIHEEKINLNIEIFPKQNKFNTPLQISLNLSFQKFTIKDLKNSLYLYFIYKTSILKF